MTSTTLFPTPHNWQYTNEDATYTHQGMTRERALELVERKGGTATEMEAR